MPEIADVVKTVDFARFVKLSPRRVQQLIAEGILPSAGHGKIDIAEGFAAFVRWRVENETGEIAPAKDGAGELAGLDAERTRKLRLANDETERRLIRTDDAIAAMDAIVGQIPADLSAVPARVTSDIPLRRKIENEHDAVLNGLAKRFRQASADLRAGRDALAADAPDVADGLGDEEP